MFIRVSTCCKECSRAIIGVVKRIIHGVVVDIFLKKLVDIEGNFAAIVLHTHTIKECTFTVYIRHIQSAKHVKRMRVVEGVVIVGCGTYIQLIF